MSLPKQQSFPASKIVVGAILYSCSAWTDDAGKTSTEVDEWVVRSIQAKRGTKSRMGFPLNHSRESVRYVNITKKIDSVTWGKRSTKNGDFGWLKSIPAFCRKQFSVGSNLPFGIYTTIRAAVFHEARSTSDLLDEAQSEIGPERDEKDISELTAQLAALKRRLAKLSTAR